MGAEAISGGSDQPSSLLGRPVETLLALSADPESPIASSAAAATALALAAGLTAMTARRSRTTWTDAAGVAGQAEVIRERAQQMIEESVEAYGSAREKLAGDIREQDEEQRDWSLGVAVTRAGAVPMAIADAGADLADLAAYAASECAADVRPDAIAAAEFAETAVRVSAGLVEANLTMRQGDPRLDQARGLQGRARSALDSCPGWSA